jgi:hypothetical protein
MPSTIIGGLIESQPDMKLVPARQGADVKTWLEETGATVVIVGLVDHELPSEYQSLLGLLPQIVIIGVMDGGTRAVLYRSEAVEELSPEDLLASARSGADRPQDNA